MRKPEEPSVAEPLSVANGTSLSVMYGEEGCTRPMLAPISGEEIGKREVLAFPVGERENPPAWEELLENLTRRGVQRVEWWMTDGMQAVLHAIYNKFPASQRRRCVKHPIVTILGYVPKTQQAVKRTERNAVCYQESRAKAEHLTTAVVEQEAAIYPSAVDCSQSDWAACLTFYDRPAKHGKFLRTTTVSEHLFGEATPDSHTMAAACRNERRCLLMFDTVIRSLRLRRTALPHKVADPLQWFHKLSTPSFGRKEKRIARTRLPTPFNSFTTLDILPNMGQYGLKSQPKAFVLKIAHIR